ncbi:MFS transporter [Bacillaceae bacterium SAS-127]|nr:MFS transporter [Bacillaceae bacterium SAS-127]
MNVAMSWPFLRLYMLAFLFFSANSILNMIIPLRGEAMGASNTTIGLIMGAYMFTCMFFRPWAGHIIHKHGPLKVLRTIILFNGFALILYTITGLGGFLIARILQGISTAFFSMALQIGIIDALSEKERSQGVSLYSLFTYMPGIIGPILALGIWENGGMNSFTLAMVAIAILTGVFGYSTKLGNQSTTAHKNEEENGSHLLKSFHHLVTNPFLFKCSLLMLTASIIFGAIATFMPLYANQLTNANAGIYLMLQAATIVIARFVLRKNIPSDGKWHNKFIVSIMLLLAISAQLVSYSAVVGVGFLYTGAILMGIAQALLYPTLTTYLTFVLPQASRNVLIGLFIAMADLGISLGGVIMGPIADLSSYSFMYTICAILGLLMAIFAYDKRPTFIG